MNITIISYVSSPFEQHARQQGGGTLLGVGKYIIIYIPDMALIDCCPRPGNSPVKYSLLAGERGLLKKAERVECRHEDYIASIRQ